MKKIVFLCVVVFILSIFPQTAEALSRTEILHDNIAKAGSLIWAERVRPDTTDFDGNLSGADNTVQKALDTLDDMVVTVGCCDLDESYDESVSGVKKITIDDGELELEAAPLYGVVLSVGNGDDIFNVYDDGCLYIDSDYGSGTAWSHSGAGSVLIFNPKTGSFRTGQVTGTEWDVGNVGPNSVGFGLNTIASSLGTVAMGSGTTASGNCAVALGLNTLASGLYSSALGCTTKARGYHGFAAGCDTICDGNETFVYGENLWVTASAADSYALGNHPAILQLPEPDTQYGVVNQHIIADPSTLGAEKVTNGTFTGSAASWTLGSGWTYNSNAVDHDGDGNATLSQNCSEEANKIYLLEFTISNYVVGDCTPTVGGTVGALVHADGTYRQMILAVNNGNLIFTPSIPARFTIDNVSLKEVVAGNLYVAGKVYAGGVELGAGGLLTRDEVYDASPSGNKIITVDDGECKFVAAVDYGVTLSVGNGDDVFKVYDDGCMYIEGDYGSGTVWPHSGEGSVMLFNPKTGAFRAGYVSGSGWDIGNVGNYSAAFGLAAALGDTSMAWGCGAAATGYGATAWGDNTVASGLHSTAFGGIDNVDGSYSFGGGDNTGSVWGDVSFLYGSNISVTAEADNSYAFGNHTDLLQLPEPDTLYAIVEEFIKADPDVLGAEKLTNGTFTGSAANWIAPSPPWTYNANAMDKDADGIGSLDQNCNEVANEIYLLVFTISNWTVGTCTPQVGGVNGAAVSANGTYRQLILATGAGDLKFVPSNTARFTIDSVSLKEVTGGDMHIAGKVYAEGVELTGDVNTNTQLIPYDFTLDDGSAATGASTYLKTGEVTTASGVGSAASGPTISYTGTITEWSFQQVVDFGAGDSYLISLYEEATLVASFTSTNGSNEFKYVGTGLTHGVISGERLSVKITDNNSPSGLPIAGIIVTVLVSR